MRNEWLRTGSKTKTRDDHMLHVGVWNNKHALWKDKGGVSKSYLPCGDTGERRSCEELPEKRNKRRADEGRLLSFTGHASSRTSGAGLVEEPKQRWRERCVCARVRKGGEPQQGYSSSQENNNKRHWFAMCLIELNTRSRSCSYACAVYN